PNPPALLLIANYRSEDVETSPFLRAFHKLLSSGSSTIDARELTVGELSVEESHQLAVSMLSKAGNISLMRAEIIAEEAKGHPFFIGELVHYLEMNAASIQVMNTGQLREASVRGTTLDQVIRARISDLSAEARCLLEVVAVSGQP